MLEFTLIDLLPTGSSNDYDFVASYDGIDYTIFTTDFFVSEVEQFFTSRKVLLRGVTPANELKRLFDLWKASRRDTYARRAYALSLDYNPLENYDRMESKQASGSVTRGTQDARTLDTKDTTEHDTQDARTLDTKDATEYDTQDARTLDTQDARTLDTQDATDYDTQDATTYGKALTTNKGLYGVNSSVAVNADTETATSTGTDTTAHTGTDTTVHTGTDTLKRTGTDTTAHTGTDTTAHTGTDTTAHTGTDTTAHTGTDTTAHTGTDTTADEYTLHVHGNVGVTTSQQMLTSDLDLLSRDLALSAVCEFIDRYTYQIEGVDL